MPISLGVQKKTFKVKILKIFLFVSLLPLLILSASNIYIVISSRQKNIAELQNLAIENASEKITKFINQKIEGMNLVVSGSARNGAPVSNLHDIDPLNLAFLIGSIKENAGEMAQSVDFIDNDGRILLRNDSTSGLTIASYFEGSGGQLPENAAKKEKIADNASAEDYFQKALSGRNYFGKLEFTGGKPLMQIASQIENQEKEIIGVIAAVIDISQIDSLVKQVNLGNTGYIYVLDRRGFIVAGSSNGKAEVGDNLASVPLVKEVMEGRIYDGLLQFTTYENKEKQELVFSGKLMNDGLWLVISEWPKDDAFLVLRNVLKLSIGISLATIVLMAFLGFYFARQIVKPIQLLAKGVKKISEGDLEYRISYSTNDEFDLLRDQFNEMAKILKENEALKEEMVHIAAHELKAPVTAIKGYVSMMMDGTFGQVPEPIMKNLAIVFSTNERLVNLVHDLLEASKAGAGKMTISLASVAITEHIQKAVTELASLAEKKNIKITYHPLDEPRNVSADAQKLDEVIVNFLSNAIKYTKEGGSVDISHLAKDGWLTTNFKDTGIGMAEEQRQKLFTKYYRIKSEETKNIEGTGLGLYICKEIIEKMGGRIEVASELGKGSVFSFGLKISL